MKTLIVIALFAIFFGGLLWLALEIRNSYPFDEEDETFLN